MVRNKNTTPLSRVQASLPLLKEIKKITCSASISWGVIHEGQILLTHAEGLRDVRQNLPANTDTAYLLASLTKAFISALCGLLVEERLLDWDTPISDYVPLQMTIDPEGGKRITMRDALSHSTGRAHMDLTWLGVEAETIVEKEDLLHVISHLPLKYDVRAGFHYNNYMYAVIGKVIEIASSSNNLGTKTWSDHLRDRIFMPLSMQRSATNRDALQDHNLAEGHMVLDDKSLRTTAPTDMSDRTTIGPAGAVWSTVPDMLKWAKALLEGMTAGDNGENACLPHLQTVMSPKIAVEASIQEDTYAMGWIRALLPSKGLGFISNNGLQRDHVLGSESRPRQLLYHNGGQSGYLSAMYLFPETRSAIVAMANSYGLGDAPDWTAHIIAEALFDLEPKRDYVALATARAEYQYNFYGSLKQEYYSRQQKGTVQPPGTDFCGTFKNDGFLMTLQVTSGTVETSASLLDLVVNNRPRQHHQLRHFHYDVWGFLPASREEYQLREFIDWRNWEQFVLRFQRDAAGRVISLLWRLQEDVEPILFVKA
ncbi:beta-lactamase/transpeptidase-like protein [Lophiotrema nucula]|uniref:Beta-lactamase/transpeptidase-like protein n=1 Tax=Lophiotrema nucula TaxID=690887 RepID=A0A6A5ZPS9_9PLEO|nr:beta-lactamase/transpeptidase-like protein [Lophiotrema nucula]